MSMTTVQAETSQCLFEFLHMEIVSQLQQETGPDKKVSTTSTSHWLTETAGRGTATTGEPGSQSGREPGGEDVTWPPEVQERTGRRCLHVQAVLDDCLQQEHWQPQNQPPGHSSSLSICLYLVIWHGVLMQDTYVLHDNAFRLLLHLSEGNQYREEAQTVSLEYFISTTPFISLLFSLSFYLVLIF